MTDARPMISFAAHLEKYPHVLCDACIVGCRESAPWLKPTELPYAPALRLWLEAKAAKR